MCCCDEEVECCAPVAEDFTSQQLKVWSGSGEGEEGLPVKNENDLRTSWIFSPS